MMQCVQKREPFKYSHSEPIHSALAFFT